MKSTEYSEYADFLAARRDFEAAKKQELLGLQLVAQRVLKKEMAEDKEILGQNLVCGSFRIRARVDHLGTPMDRGECTFKVGEVVGFRGNCEYHMCRTATIQPCYAAIVVQVGKSGHYWIALSSVVGEEDPDIEFVPYNLRLVDGYMLVKCFAL